MSARLQAAFVAPSCAYMRGHGSRELLTEVLGRPPVYGSRLRAWHAQPHNVTDAIAVAEERGIKVEIVEESHLLRLAGLEFDEMAKARAESRGELW